MLKLNLHNIDLSYGKVNQALKKYGNKNDPVIKIDEM